MSNDMTLYQTLLAAGYSVEEIEEALSNPVVLDEYLKVIERSQS